MKKKNTNPQYFSNALVLLIDVCYVLKLPQTLEMSIADLQEASDYRLGTAGIKF